MRRREYILVVLFCFSIASLAWSQKKQPSPVSRGTISEENNYTNPALGMTINLPGDWRLLEMTTETPDDPGCTGPLCGAPDINVVLESKPGSSPGYRLYLSAWKLSEPYLNRSRYPLKWFAGIMLEGSMDSDLEAFEKQTAIQFDGKPAFRLLMAGHGEKAPRVLGYVSESRGYVFLLVGAAPLAPHPLQSAIESLTLR
jgi:hypothetical protein